MVREGDLLWTPPPELVEGSAMARYLAWLRETRGLDLPDYDAAWRWSVEDLEGFWRSILERFEVRAEGSPEPVLPERRMPGARWFPGLRLNHAEHLLREPDDRPAIVYRREDGFAAELTRAELADAVARAAAGLRRLGVRAGGRVGAFLPNAPEAAIALLACSSIGAIWSACSPEFGVRAVLDRFGQIEPKVLLAVDGYRYGGRAFDRLGVVAEIAAGLPGLEHLVLVPSLREDPLAAARAVPGFPPAMAWSELLAEPASGPGPFTRVPFEHPLWILYSSGTTGLPKPIVQGHGGILLEHLKAIALHHDVGPGERFFWFTTTGWMMWNFLLGGLALGATVVLYDGSPSFPDLTALWRLAAEVGITTFGTSAPFIHACMKAGVRPAEVGDLSRLRAVGSTGAPLSPEGFAWVYEAVGRDVWLGSMSGGTDLCTAFVGANPLLPVHAGELQCRYLGADVRALDLEGRELVGEVGELVLASPMPSMPLGFWGDPDGERYRRSYFDVYPGLWRHGDWIRITERGSCVIYGRSDATLNRAGVRIGTSELYRVVEAMPEVRESLAVDTGELGREGELILFVALAPGVELDEALRRRMSEALRTELSPRHVPDRILAVPAIPTTLNGKRLEVPIKRILLGARPEEVVSPAALSDPDALGPFLEIAASLRRG